jgi:hypothetical protein
MTGESATVLYPDGHLCSDGRLYYVPKCRLPGARDS